MLKLKEKRLILILANLLLYKLGELKVRIAKSRIMTDISGERRETLN